MERGEKWVSNCPGSLTTRLEFRRPYGFNIPTYVSGTLKVHPSLPRDMGSRSRRPAKIQHTHRPMEMPTCRDNFAIAKKFHTENLEHQPLPDRVDDRVFAGLNFGRAKSCGSLASLVNRARCQHGVTPKGFQKRTWNEALNQIHGPVLGCKVPQTRMDLAICWDAPIDPTYEPRRPVHIDGSDGGPAPGIFTLVQHPADDSSSSGISSPNFFRPRAASADPGKFERLVKAPPRHRRELCKTAFSKFSVDRETVKSDSPADDDPVARSRLELLTGYKADVEEAENAAEDPARCHLCEDFAELRISEAESDLAKRYTSSPEHGIRDRRKHASYLRNCTACQLRRKDEEKEARKHRQRLALHSAAPKLDAGGDRSRKNGLPSAANVPRPRTPFARRNFCIDTLTPPFSVVKGCRDADYPEHWRLTSVYQQSYRPPRNYKPTFPCPMKR